MDEQGTKDLAYQEPNGGVYTPQTQGKQVLGAGGALEFQVLRAEDLRPLSH